MASNQHLLLSKGEKRLVLDMAAQLGCSMSELFRRAWAWYEDHDGQTEGL